MVRFPTIVNNEYMLMNRGYQA